MTEIDAYAGSKVPFCRRWHVIAEIDLARLVADHSGLEHMCRRLEAIADALPDLPAPEETDWITAELDMLSRHNDAEDRLMEGLFRREARDPLARSVLDHIRGRHIACTVLGQDLVAALAPDPDAPVPTEPEALGYMLRCFFEGCRDAIAFEELAILALGGLRLTADARALLVDRIARRS
ncbi:hemerythrin domain-containing protein [Sphingomonas sp.]|uniref:hemerythrin domain-containing protein n=1 Tax=Sphingomonas sp. TaxID=28214 RepID=UPI000DB3715D|nr:hemerythrin domain-containing protein [Sphingomonas sp.]PZU10715.1 MAG: hypothetical protein DI605_03445 [Sphingomonas sp.]